MKHHKKSSFCNTFIPRNFKPDYAALFEILAAQLKNKKQRQETKQEKAFALEVFTVGAILQVALLASTLF